MLKLTRPWHTWPKDVRVDFLEAQDVSFGGHRGPVVINRESIRYCSPAGDPKGSATSVCFHGLEWENEVIYLGLSYDEFKAWWIGITDEDCD